MKIEAVVVSSGSRSLLYRRFAPVPEEGMTVYSTDIFQQRYSTTMVEESGYLWFEITDSYP